MASSRPNLKEALARTAASKTTGLRSSVASERAAALAAAQGEVQQAGETDRWHRQRETQECEQHVQATLAELADRVESQRRACAAAVMAEAADGKSGSLRKLIDEWRAEPSRLLTSAIRIRWSELDARCMAEVGMPLGHHILIQAMLDSIAAGGDAGAFLYTSSTDFGCFGNQAIEAAGAFARAKTPADTQHALEQLESALVTAAKRGEGQVASEAQLQWHELRRTNATHGDLANAQSMLAEKHRAAEQARFAASYVPPSRERPVLMPTAEADGGGGLLERARGWILR